MGSALACLANGAGYTVAAVTAEHREKAEEFSKATGFPAFIDNVEAATLGDIIFLTVPDRKLPMVMESLVNGKRLRCGQILLHTSGALAGEVLAPARKFGVEVGSMHPLQSFADIETARQNLSGSFFAIDGDEKAVAAANRLAVDLGGRILRVPPEERVLYHAAACLASNYVVALLHIAESLLSRWTNEEHEALQALLPLVTGTLRNVAEQGTAAALTGPILRGDASTVAQHLKALPEELLSVYQSLGQATLQLSGDRIPQGQRELISNMLAADGRPNKGG
ncbi:MAG: oxidoreductase coenzyme F420-dependent [Sporomusa sp.]|nr:oxidoreductase coenzyme F420-dependent [Sporomusa sp.]